MSSVSRGLAHLNRNSRSSRSQLTGGTRKDLGGDLQVAAEPLEREVASRENATEPRDVREDDVQAQQSPRQNVLVVVPAPGLPGGAVPAFLVRELFPVARTDLRGRADE